MKSAKTKRLASAAAKVAKTYAKLGANSASWPESYQPKEPKFLKK